MENRFNASIIIPAYNERHNLSALLQRLFSLDHSFTYEVIIVDSGSTDGSHEEIERLKKTYSLNLLRLPRNKGKGFAVRSGLRLAQGEIIIIQDADLEYDPLDYNALVQSIKDQENGFVLGSRTLLENKWRIRKSAEFNLSLEIINIGSQLMSWLFCRLYSVKISDTQTMYKVFKRHLIQDIHFTCDRFDFDMELLAKLVLKGCLPQEIPVRYNSRTAAEGKKLNFLKDGLQTLSVMLKIRIAHVFKNFLKFPQYSSRADELRPKFLPSANQFLE